MSLTKKEKEILKSITIGSENNPDRPEFPPDNPKWPSTPVKKIMVTGFNNVYLKDESVNPSGTHKDRMAWEMVVTYKQLLSAKESDDKITKLPQMSIISSGSAANAIQKMLKKYHLPNLKILVDYNLDRKIKTSLEKIGCELYETNLSKKTLLTNDILKITDNIDGIDITSDDSLGPFDIFYDWMSYDILNQNADYVFIPYGTGHLYENIINVAIKEVSRLIFHDKRLKADIKQIRKCNFIGSTTDNPKTKADKLFSPHLPFIHFDTNWIKMAINKRLIGEESSIHVIREKYIDEALEIAKKNKIDCEPSGIAGLALMLQMKNKLPENKKMLIINTGKTKYN